MSHFISPHITLYLCWSLNLKWFPIDSIARANVAYFCYWWRQTIFFSVYTRSCHYIGLRWKGSGACKGKYIDSEPTQYNHLIFYLVCYYSPDLFFCLLISGSQHNSQVKSKPCNEAQKVLKGNRKRLRSDEEGSDDDIMERDVVVAARKENILVTAFHPELTNDARWHLYFLKEIVGVEELHSKTITQWMCVADTGLCTHTLAVDFVCIFSAVFGIQDSSNKFN